MPFQPQPFLERNAAGYSSGGGANPSGREGYFWNIPRAKRGLTVIEMLVAAALFAASFMILIGAFPLAARAIRLAQVRNIAHHLAQSRLERLNVAAYADVAAGGPEGIDVTVINNGISETIPFSLTQDVTVVSTGLKHVRVTLRWTRDSRDQSLFLETDVAKYAP